MRYSEQMKHEIKTLRANGHTFDEINIRLNTQIAKSSLSYICKEVKVTSMGNERLTTLKLKQLQKARSKAIHSNRLILEQRFKKYSSNAMNIVSNIDIQSKKVALAMLYWGEGSKWQSFRGLSLGTSDPNMLLSYILLLEQCYGLNRKSFKCRLILRADQQALILENFWSSVLSIPSSNFYKSYFDKRTIGKQTKKFDYKGVCVVVSAGSDIQLELAAIGQELLRSMNQKQETSPIPHI